MSKKLLQKDKNPITQVAAQAQKILKRKKDIIDTKRVEVVVQIQILMILITMKGRKIGVN